MIFMLIVSKGLAVGGITTIVKRQAFGVVRES
jgi:hypothetical protein